MTQICEIEEEVKKTSKKKAKKRPSDFEIARALFQKIHERKLPFLVKDMGEDSDIFFLCSKPEDEFTYGSSELCILLLECTDPELKNIFKSVLDKFHGLQKDYGYQRLINLRDQFSEFSKTKGEPMAVAVEENEFGSSWTIKEDINGKTKTLYYSKAIDSLFHMQLIKSWCKSYRPLLSSEDPNYLIYPYQHEESDTGSILTLPPKEDVSHPITSLYPNGFRVMVTKGIDVLCGKITEEFPYPILHQDLIIFQDQAAACQMAHRVTGEGWRMVLLRPSAVFFPTPNILLRATGYHNL